MQEVLSHMKSNNFSEALEICKSELEHDASNWNINYLAGQCYRFLNDMENAIKYLKLANLIKPNDHCVLLALGIALQLSQLYDDAIDIFNRAIQIDPDYYPAYNSLALTFKKVSNFDLALQSYDDAIKALTRNIVKKLTNDKDGKIYRDYESNCFCWAEYAIYGAIYLCKQDSKIDSVAWPSTEMVLYLKDTDLYGGLYWVDELDSENQMVRIFLPNYLNSMREHLKQSDYVTLLGNMGMVLELLGRNDEASNFIYEASNFRNEQ